MATATKEQTDLYQYLVLNTFLSGFLFFSNLNMTISTSETRSSKDTEDTSLIIRSTIEKY